MSISVESVCTVTLNKGCSVFFLSQRIFFYLELFEGNTHFKRIAGRIFSSLRCLCVTIIGLGIYAQNSLKFDFFSPSRVISPQLHVYVYTRKTNRTEYFPFYLRANIREHKMLHTFVFFFVCLFRFEWSLRATNEWILIALRAGLWSVMQSKQFDLLQPMKKNVHRKFWP